MKKYLSAFLSFSLILIISFLGCKGYQVLNPKKPITLTLWHNYGGQMKDIMDEMIDEFNETIGTEKGIIINVTSISGSSALHEKTIMAANGDPGAPELPDITTAYPKTALKLKEKDLLVDQNQYFTNEELSAYVPEFVQEGNLEEGGLYVFPIAKSTEVLFVNTTIFDKFAKDTGARLNDLETFEGIIKTAALYYQWSGGKMFYMPDSLFNFTQVGYKQLGDEFILQGELNLSSPYFTRVWDCFYEPAVLGYIAIFDGYASDLAKTGDIVCSTGSTAGVVFFSPQVTYEDNTTEAADFAILPYPTFEGGKKIAIQRGGGMCVTKSNKQKEYGAGVFLKWFTSPDNNLRFVSSTGYLPVTKEAFNKIMTFEMKEPLDENIKKLLQTAKIMQEKYDFYIPPLYENIDDFQRKYEDQLKKAASESRAIYLELLKDGDIKTPYRIASEGAIQSFIDEFR